MTTNERHALYANTDTGLTFRVGQPVKWDRAIQRWYRLDDRRRFHARTHTIRHDGRTYTVESFEVRATDPHGRGLGSPRHALAFPVPFRLCKVR